MGSGFYGNLEFVTNKLAEVLLRDENFVKYLYYNDEDPLSKPTLKDPLIILNDRLVLQPKSIYLETEEGILVEMFLHGDTPQRASGGLLTEYIINFNIVCHLGSWKIKNGIRPYRVMNIIDSAFNGRKIEGVSFGSIKPLGSRFIRFADHWEGYRLSYSLTWNGNKEC